MKKAGKARGLADDRFARVKSDPKFSNIHKEDKKIVIEKRFSALLTDERFADALSVDKRGKPLRKKKSDLTNLFVVEDDEDDESTDTVEVKQKDKKLKKIPPSEGQKKKTKKVSEKKVAKKKSNDSEGSSDSDEEDIIKVDLARGDGNVSSSEDSDSEESEWEIPQELEEQMNIAQMDGNCEQVEWASRRLAACNLDWDIVKAEDIYILVKSFVPAGGSVVNVTIYLSDFGKEKLENEERLGPRLDILDPNKELDDDDPQAKFAVRKYNVDKLKYYYAVIECDAESTATNIYENCDGVLFENTGLKMDLRFVPDDMVFDEDRIHEVLEEGDLNLEKYRSKSKLTANATSLKGDIRWDDEDYERTHQVREAFLKDDFGTSKIIADSDSEDDAAVATRREALLSLIAEKPKDSGLKITWDNDEDNGSGSDDSDFEKALARRHEEEDSDDEKQNTRKHIKSPEKVKKSGYKEYLEKKKEKGKEKKLLLRQAREQGRTANDVMGEPLKKKVKAQTRATLKDLDYGTATAVLGDERFNALLTDSAFTIEQTNSSAKGSKLIELQAHAKKASKVPQAPKEELLLDNLKAKAAKWNSKKKK